MNNKQRRELAEHLGNCRKCFKLPAEPSRSKCINCLSKDRERRKREYDLRRYAGKCGSCGVDLLEDEPTTALCIKCLNYQRNYRRMRSEQTSQ